MRCVNLETNAVMAMMVELEESFESHDFDALKKCLADLNTQELQLIELRFFEQRAFKEVAEILEITENNAKVRAYRILEKLKNLFPKYRAK